MPELTRVAPSDVSRIAVLGASLKMEVVELSPAEGAGVIQDDTYESRLGNPQFGFAFPNGDNAAGAYGLTVTTADNDKTVTFNVTNGSLDNDRTIVAVVFGL
jgi:hypothetical protein